MSKKVISAGHICLDITPVFPDSTQGQPLRELLCPGKLIHMDGVAVHTGGSVDNTGLALKLLGNEERVMEIAQMMSGDNISEAAINNAQELLGI